MIGLYLLTILNLVLLLVLLFRLHDLTPEQIARKILQTRNDQIISGRELLRHRLQVRKGANPE